LQIIVKGKGKTTKRRFADANVTVEQNLSLDQLLSNGKHEEELDSGKRAKSDNGDKENTLMFEKKETIREVGLTDPLGNFKEMIANREEDLVTNGKINKLIYLFIYLFFLRYLSLFKISSLIAVEQMCQVTEHFVKSSFGTSLYDKALECLKLLRETCAKVYYNITF